METVAHEAAFRGCLPEGFQEWDLLDANRMMVAELAFSHRGKACSTGQAFEASRVSSEIEGHQVKAFIRRGGVESPAAGWSTEKRVCFWSILA